MGAVTQKIRVHTIQNYFLRNSAHTPRQGDLFSGMTGYIIKQINVPAQAVNIFHDCGKAARFRLAFVKRANMTAQYSQRRFVEMILSSIGSEEKDKTIPCTDRDHLYHNSF